MPVVVKLSPDEVRAELDKGKSQRQIVTEQYDTMLEGFSPSDWGEVKLDVEEKRATVRNRLKAAAQRRGLAIRFKRGQGDRMRFEVYPIDSAPPEDDEPEEIEEEPLPPPLPVATKPKRKRKGAEAEVAVETKRKPGRPRSVEA